VIKTAQRFGWHAVSGNYSMQISQIGTGRPLCSCACLRTDYCPGL